ncbi:hypothetical protein [Paenibacillus sp. HJGM_3]|uniref:hypothetical protein n=1 Tax=Paenibacillus sp. HJGM_3 TaxID=3379816 RepID=UPI00385DE0E8
MNRTHFKTFRFRIGKNKFLVIKIQQSATAKTESGNALASNALNVKILKEVLRNRRRRR